LKTYSSAACNVTLTHDKQTRKQVGRGVGVLSPLKNFSFSWKMCWTYLQTKNLGPSQKTFRPTWCPKLITGLATSVR